MIFYTTCLHGVHLDPYRFSCIVCIVELHWLIHQCCTQLFILGLSWCYQLYWSVLIRKVWHSRALSACVCVCACEFTVYTVYTLHTASCWKHVRVHHCTVDGWGGYTYICLTFTIISKTEAAVFEMSSLCLCSYFQLRLDLYWNYFAIYAKGDTYRWKMNLSLYDCILWKLQPAVETLVNNFGYNLSQINWYNASSSSFILYLIVSGCLQ